MARTKASAMRCSARINSLEKEKQKTKKTAKPADRSGTNMTLRLRKLPDSVLAKHGLTVKAVRATKKNKSVNTAFIDPGARTSTATTSCPRAVKATKKTTAKGSRKRKQPPTEESSDSEDASAISPQKRARKTAPARKRRRPSADNAIVKQRRRSVACCRSGENDYYVFQRDFYLHDEQAGELLEIGQFIGKYGVLRENTYTFEGDDEPNNGSIYNIVYTSMPNGESFTDLRKEDALDDNLPTRSDEMREANGTKCYQCTYCFGLYGQGCKNKVLDHMFGVIDKRTKKRNPDKGCCQRLTYRSQYFIDHGCYPADLRILFTGEIDLKTNILPPLLTKKTQLAIVPNVIPVAAVVAAPATAPVAPVVAAPATAPVAAPASAPVAAPATATVAAPATAPVAAPATAPVAAPATTPVAAPATAPVVVSVSTMVASAVSTDSSANVSIPKPVNGSPSTSASVSAIAVDLAGKLCNGSTAESASELGLECAPGSSVAVENSNTEEKASHSVLTTTTGGLSGGSTGGFIVGLPTAQSFDPVLDITSQNSDELSTPMECQNAYDIAKLEIIGAGENVTSIEVEEIEIVAGDGMASQSVDPTTGGLSGGSTGGFIVGMQTAHSLDPVCEITLPNSDELRTPMECQNASDIAKQIIGAGENVISIEVEEIEIIAGDGMASQSVDPTTGGLTGGYIVALPTALSLNPVGDIALKNSGGTPNHIECVNADDVTKPELNGTEVMEAISFVINKVEEMDIINNEMANQSGLTSASSLTGVLPIKHAMVPVGVADVLDTSQGITAPTENKQVVKFVTGLVASSFQEVFVMAVAKDQYIV